MTFMANFGFVTCALQGGTNAAALAVAQQYVSAFDKLAKTNNTLILPNNVGDIPSAVAQVRNYLNK